MKDQSSTKAKTTAAVILLFTVLFAANLSTNKPVSNSNNESLRGLKQQADRALQFRVRSADGTATGGGGGSGDVETFADDGAASKANATGFGGGFSSGSGRTFDGDSSISSNGFAGGEAGGRAAANSTGDAAENAATIGLATTRSFGAGSAGGNGGGAGLIAFSQRPSQPTPSFVVVVKGNSKDGGDVTVVNPTPAPPVLEEYALALGSGSGYADTGGNATGAEIGGQAGGTIFGQATTYGDGYGSGTTDIVANQGEGASGGGGGRAFGTTTGVGAVSGGGVLAFNGTGGGFSAGGGSGTLGRPRMNTP